jgi:hypothetical protein
MRADILFILPVVIATGEFGQFFRRRWHMAEKTPARAPGDPHLNGPADAREEIVQRRLVTIQLQSDLAYFQARLGLIGEPKTTNQEAQRRTFKLLHQAVGQQMIRTRKTGAGRSG